MDTQTTVEMVELKLSPEMEARVEKARKIAKKVAKGGVALLATIGAVVVVTSVAGAIKERMSDSEDSQDEVQLIEAGEGLAQETGA